MTGTKPPLPAGLLQKRGLVSVQLKGVDLAPANAGTSGLHIQFQITTEEVSRVEMGVHRQSACNCNEQVAEE